MNTPSDSIDTSSIPTISPGYRLQHEQAQDGWVLLYPEGMVKLNPSAAEILQRCDGKRKLSEVIAQLESDFGETNLERDVLDFMQIANQQKWVKVE